MLTQYHGPRTKTITVNEPLVSNPMSLQTRLWISLVQTSSSVTRGTIPNKARLCVRRLSHFARSVYSSAKISHATGTVTMPNYFEITTVGGDHIKHFNTTVYDTQGGAHTLSAALTRTNTANQWDMVLASITGNVNTLTSGNRRIRGIQFSASDGSYSGLDSGLGDTAQFTVTFAHDTANPQTISMALGTTGQFDGLTQFAGNSTAVAR